MRIHHTAICTRDMAASVRFWREGLGFSDLMNERFEGDWPTLFRARKPVLHSIFLGDPDEPQSGIIELVDFEGGVEDGTAPAEPTEGFFLVSVYTDIEAALERMAALGFGGAESRIELDVGVKMAVLLDPNGVRVELIDLGGGPA